MVRIKRALARWAARHHFRIYHSYGRKSGKRRTAALFLCLSAVLVLFGKLPLISLMPGNKERLLKKAELENQEMRESLQNSDILITKETPEGAILVVAQAVGNLPEPVIYEDETEPESSRIDLEEVLLDRFGALAELSFRDFFSNYYIVDSSTSATEALFSPKKLISFDFSVQKTEKPQILLYHTHGSEAYLDSKKGNASDTVVGAGEILAKELTEQYGFQVLHVKTLFDKKADGSDDRDNSYNNSLPVITKILNDYPEIEVVIDLHRDSGNARTSVINGEKTAKIMLFNGLCRTKSGPITYYSNQNLQENLSFSFCTQVTGNELFPGLMHRIYLKSYRYNMHLTGKYLLVELGTENNTVAEAKAAMKPFAKVIATVLQGGAVAKKDS